MAPTKQMVDRRMAAFEQACRERGIKLTHQRLAIYRAVAANDAHPDADTVYRAVRGQIPRLSLDTVYRNLRQLADQGLLSIVGMSQDRLRFDANLGHHHHFVCVKCGLIRDFESGELDAVPIPPGAEAFGRPLATQLDVRGVCHDCLNPKTH